MLKSSLVWAQSDVLRLYYEAGSCNTGLADFGVAEAPLEDLPGICQQPAGALVVTDRMETGAQKVRSSTRIVSIPNPTRGGTLVGIELAPERRSGEANLVVYDVVGRVVRELWSGRAEEMPYHVAWDGRDSGGTRVADGRYLVRLRIDGEGEAAEWVTLLR